MNQHLSSYVIKPALNARVAVSSGQRSLDNGLSPHLYLYTLHTQAAKALMNLHTFTGTPGSCCPISQYVPITISCAGSRVCLPRTLESTDVSKMHNNRTILIFIETGNVRNCITAV